MKSNLLPFNVDLIDLTPQRLQALKPVRSTDLFDNVTGGFAEDGLFSVSIFGRVGDEARDLRFSYIDLKTSIFHPTIYRALTRLKVLYKGILDGRAYAVWDPKEKDFVGADEMTGETGFAFFMSHWQDIQFRASKSPIRNQRVAMIKKYKHRATVNKLLVLPAGLRDLEVDENGRTTQDEINEIYRKVISISRVIADTDGKENSPVLNNSRKALQDRFNEIYDLIERMLTGKKGFIQAKWATRRIFNGTRNVISAMDTSTKLLGAANAPKYTDTVLGLFQVIKGALPLTVNLLRQSYLSEAFQQGDSSTQAKLVNPKTWQAEYVDLPSDVRDRWVTVEGLEKVVESYRHIKNRNKPIMIKGYYLALLYKGPDNTFRIFGDIRELPEHLDRAHVQPLTLVQLLYLCGYQTWNTLKTIVTRYPVTGMGSTYPSTVYVKTTIVGEVRRELDHSWQPYPDEENRVALEFPTLEPEAFVDSQVIHPSRLSGLGADFDGDTASSTIVYSQEAIEEIERHLSSKEAYLDPRGGFRASANVATVNLVLRNMTGD